MVHVPEFTKFFLADTPFRVGECSLSNSIDRMAREDPFHTPASSIRLYRIRSMSLKTQKRAFRKPRHCWVKKITGLALWSFPPFFSEIPSLRCPSEEKIQQYIIM